MTTSFSLDNFDRKILQILQHNAALPQKILAEQVGLSVSAVSRRIHAMSEAGVIAAMVAVVDSKKVGKPIRIIVEITLEQEHTALMQDIKARLVACPQVQQVYYVTGRFDFLVIMLVKDMEEYEALTQTLFLDAPNIKRFETYVCMQAVKQGLAVALNGL